MTAVETNSDLSKSHQWQRRADNSLFIQLEQVLQRQRFSSKRVTIFAIFMGNQRNVVCIGQFDVVEL